MQKQGMFTFPPQYCKFGFTLIELSIVLVIIGLVVGGVLVGRDLIKASEIRAQIAQIEKYKTAVNTFRIKYGSLPGDISASNAASLGFTSRTGAIGDGDGNGVIEAPTGDPNDAGLSPAFGELCYLWIDLTGANGGNVNLIDGKYTGLPPDSVWTSGICNQLGSIIYPPDIDGYFPKAKLGRGNYIYVWSGGISWSSSLRNGIAYFGIARNVGVNRTIFPDPGLTVNEAYSIDQKIDDGLPRTGKVISAYVSSSQPFWSPNESGTPTTYTLGQRCIDVASEAYLIDKLTLDSVNCYLSFQFQ